MKKSLAIICVIITAIAVVCCLCACSGEVDVDRLYRKCDAVSEFDRSDVITVEATGCSVYVQGGALRDIVFNFKRSDVVVSAQGTTYSVSGSGKDAFVLLTVPENMLGSALAVNARGGDVQVEDVELQSLAVNASDGNVYISDCEVVGSLAAVASGNVYCEGDATSVSLQADKGNVRFDLQSHDITITVRQGSVRGTVDHPEYWFAITAHTGSGRSNLVNRAGDSTYTLSVNIVNKGNIRILFDND